MKKHKSVVAILLAVMMIFTMMPTMAFAAKATGWDEAKEYASVTDSNGDAYKTLRTWNADGYPALIKAVATAKKVDQAVGESDGVAPTVDDKGEGANVTAFKYFYSLDGSALVYGNSEKNLLDGATVEYSWFKHIENNVQVKVDKPSYVDGYKATDADNFELVALNEFEGWTATVKTSKYDEEKKAENQKITVSIEWKPEGEVTGSLDAPEKIGVVKTAEITVKGTPKTPAEAKYYFDEVGGADLANGFYDGTAHTVVCDEVPGYTVSYEVYNTATGKWDAVSAVTITEPLEEPMQARATFKKGTSDTQQIPFDVNLNKAGTAYVGFTGEVNLVKGSTYNATDYVKAFSIDEYDKDTTPADRKAVVKLKDAATKKAVAANEKDLIAYLNEAYDLVVTEDQWNPNLVDLSYDTKDLTKKESDALKEKYKAVINRFDFISLGAASDVVALNGIDPADYEIEFTQAPAKKVIKTKKAKSTKTVKFSVTAECKNGTLVKYKLINAPKKSISIDANTGKITVKKGLAKGTYTFKVKAYIPTSRVNESINKIYNIQGRDTLNEIQTIKVVVKQTKKAKKK